MNEKDSAEEKISNMQERIKDFEVLCEKYSIPEMSKNADYSIHHHSLLKYK
jgi:hypothetical protein